jgi:multiple antibiotic resistance protein
MKPLLDFVLASFAALFPVVDPIGSVPIFLVLTAGTPKCLRDRYALRITKDFLRQPPKTWQRRWWRFSALG